MTEYQYSILTDNLFFLTFSKWIQLVLFGDLIIGMIENPVISKEYLTSKFFRHACCQELNFHGDKHSQRIPMIIHEVLDPVHSIT